jgi:hypothetical protein
MKNTRKEQHLTDTEKKKMKGAKKSYARPEIKEHDTLDKVSGCSLYVASYVSGFGYYH